MLFRVDERDHNMVASFSQHIRKRKRPVARYSPTPHPRPLSYFHKRIHVLIQIVIYNSFT